MRDLFARVPSPDFAEAIAYARRRIPSQVLEVVPVRFCCGVDPRWAGLHRYDESSHGFDYGEVAHFARPANLARPASDRLPTIVLPRPVPPEVIVHEYGHALDAFLGERHKAEPVTDYAKADRFEAFAEAFLGWAWPPHRGSDERPVDPATSALFDRL